MNRVIIEANSSSKPNRRPDPEYSLTSSHRSFNSSPSMWWSSQIWRISRLVSGSSKQGGAFIGLGRHEVFFLGLLQPIKFAPSILGLIFRPLVADEADFDF